MTSFALCATHMVVGAKKIVQVLGMGIVALVLSPVLLAQTADHSASSPKAMGLMHDVAGVLNSAPAVRPAATPPGTPPSPPAAANPGPLVPKDAAAAMTPWAQAKFAANKGGSEGTLDPYRNCEPLG